jgi:hypothetical protein
MTLHLKPAIHARLKKAAKAGANFVNALGNMLVIEGLDRLEESQKKIKEGRKVLADADKGN